MANSAYSFRTTPGSHAVICNTCQADVGPFDGGEPGRHDSNCEYYIGPPDPWDRWQCYSGTGANEAIEFAVQEFEVGFNPTTWDDIENAVRGLYEREFVPRSNDGACDTEPRCAIQDYGQELAARKGIHCPYDEWEGWL